MYRRAAQRGTTCGTRLMSGLPLASSQSRSMTSVYALPASSTGPNLLARLESSLDSSRIEEQREPSAVIGPELFGQLEEWIVHRLARRVQADGCERKLRPGSSARRSEYRSEVGFRAARLPVGKTCDHAGAGRRRPKGGGEKSAASLAVNVICQSAWLDPQRTRCCCATACICDRIKLGPEVHARARAGTGARTECRHASAVYDPSKRGDVAIVGGCVSGHDPDGQKRGPFVARDRAGFPGPPAQSDQPRSTRPWRSFDRG